MLKKIIIYKICELHGETDISTRLRTLKKLLPENPIPRKAALSSQL